MPVGDLIFVCRYLLTDVFGEQWEHHYYKRVNSGREGIAQRDRIVSNGKNADDQIVVLSCSFYPVEGAAQAA
jgi:hypothetical protein